MPRVSICHKQFECGASSIDYTVRVRQLVTVLGLVTLYFKIYMAFNTHILQVCHYNVANTSPLPSRGWLCSLTDVVK